MALVSSCPQLLTGNTLAEIVLCCVGNRAIWKMENGGRKRDSDRKSLLNIRLYFLLTCQTPHDPVLQYIVLGCPESVNKLETKNRE